MESSVVVANYTVPGVNCSTNLTLLEADEPEAMTAMVYATAVSSALSFVSCLVFVVQNICSKTHNQWPHSQIQWLAYSLLVWNAAVLVGGIWGFRASDFPEGFCIAQGYVIQFASVMIFSWFMVITVTMRQMITQQNSVYDLADKSRVASLVGVFLVAFLFTIVPIILQFGPTEFIIVHPALFGTWCWVATCQWPYWQLVLLMGGMLAIVMAGSVVALIAVRKLWEIRKYSSQNFQPRIRIYILRRLSFVLIYAIQIGLLLVTWIIYHITLDKHGFAFVAERAVACSAGVLLLLAFGLPDKCCMCKCRESAESRAATAQTTAALLMQAERDESAQERASKQEILHFDSDEVRARVSRDIENSE